MRRNVRARFVRFLLLGSFAASALVWVVRTTHAQPAAHPSLREVVVVYKTHFDIGYTDLQEAVVRRYRTKMIDDALAVIDATKELPKDQQFQWTLPSWPLTQMLWPEQEPARRARIEAAIRAGRIRWHALPFTTETDSLELEELVRGLGFASRLSRTYSVELPRAAKMTDVPEHTWLLPTLLRSAGVEMLHHGCNSGSMPPEVPTLFWWEGPDGSRLLTFYSRDYGTDLVPPADWPHRTWLALIMTGDNQGPPTAEAVQKLLERAKTELPGVRLRFGSLSDFADAILAEKPQLPVVHAEMPDTWIQGIMSKPIPTRQAQNLRPMLTALGLLDAELRAWGIDRGDLRKPLDQAYEQSLYYGEHTWGLNSSFVGHRYGEEWRRALGRGRYARFMQSFAQHARRIAQAATIVNPALADRETALAGAVGAAGPRIVAFNPLPWPRAGLVTASVTAGDWTSVRDAASGRVFPGRQNGREVSFWASDLPAAGYRTFVPVSAGPGPGLAEALAAPPPAGPAPAPGKPEVVPATPATPAAPTPAAPAPATSTPTQAPVTQPAAASAPAAEGPAPETLENAHFKLRVDAARGGIVSLVDKVSGRELVATDRGQLLGQYLHQRFDLADVERFHLAYNRIHGGWAWNDFGKPNLPGRFDLDHRDVSPEKWTGTLETTPYDESIVLKAPPPDKETAAIVGWRALSLRLTLPKDAPYLDVEWSIEGKAPNPIPEGGWLCFPLAIADPTFHLGRVGSVVDPARDLVRGANHHLFAVSSGVVVRGADGFGVGLVSPDVPLVSLDSPGLWRYSPDFVPKQASVFFNLYNNMWSTNFPLWIAGSWSARVRLWVVRDRDDAKGLLAPGWEARTPVVAGFADGPAGRLPKEAAGLRLSRAGVLVTALTPNPDGEGLLLRVWENAGQAGPLAVTLPSGLGVTQAQPVDLRGRPREAPLRIARGTFSFPLGAFAPASFVLRR